ncbi:hypothetical protein [Oscillatoria nigro-viridis]|uniref:hypothetical protein n=1 Tax=Phormidium nigroviride TaxID=482564 RepID=UPI00123739EA|nr:hypothetical protein [Oscillatoria nigro-viridis]
MSIHSLQINTKFALNFRHSGNGWFWSAIDPGGGGVRSTFSSLLALWRNITAQKKSKREEIRIGNGELAFLNSLFLPAND